MNEDIFEAATEGVRRGLGEAQPPKVGGQRRKRVTETETLGPHLTDKGNAVRLVKAHGQDLRYCWPWSKWLVWDGQRWRTDATGEVHRRAKNITEAMYREALGLQPDPRAALIRHALATEKAARLSAMVDLARSEAGIPVLPEALGGSPWLFNVLNGTLDLQTGRLREHRREDLIAVVAPVKFDASARCPLWESMLRLIFKDNAALIGYMQRLLGYALTGLVTEQILPILWGGGNNGKSTLVNTVLDIMGPDYGGKASRDLLMARKADSHPTVLADLFGRRFVVCIESEEDGRLDETMVKELTGSDPLKARRMREDYWQFNPTHKCFLATNHKPRVRGRDKAIWRRPRLIPFEVAFWDPAEGQMGPPELRVDKDFPHKLRAEFPGILAWMVRGCLAWQCDGMGTPEEVIAATAAYREEQDVLAEFLAECCYTGDSRYRCRAAPLYKAYREWCDRTGEKEPLSGKKFPAALESRGIARTTSNGVWYVGVALQSSDPE